MSDVAALTKIFNRLADKYCTPGKAAAERLHYWLASAVPMGFPAILARHLAEQHVSLPFDAFWQELPFAGEGVAAGLATAPSPMHANFARTRAPIFPDEVVLNI